MNPLPSMSIACLVLGISRNMCNRYINLSHGFHSQVLNTKVTMSNPGAEFKKGKPVHRTEAPLVLKQGELTDLPPVSFLTWFNYFYMTFSFFSSLLCLFKK